MPYWYKWKASIYTYTWVYEFRKIDLIGMTIIHVFEICLIFFRTIYLYHLGVNLNIFKTCTRTLYIKFKVWFYTWSNQILYNWCMCKCRFSASSQACGITCNWLRIKTRDYILLVMICIMCPSSMSSFCTSTLWIVCSKSSLICVLSFFNMDVNLPLDIIKPSSLTHLYIYLITATSTYVLQRIYKHVLKLIILLTAFMMTKMTKALNAWTSLYSTSEFSYFF